MRNCAVSLIPSLTFLSSRQQSAETRVKLKIVVRPELQACGLSLVEAVRRAEPRHCEATSEKCISPTPKAWLSSVRNMGLLFLLAQRIVGSRMIRTPRWHIA